jgi:hypothetical protein
MSQEPAQINGISQNPTYAAPLNFNTQPQQIPPTVKVVSSETESGFIIVNVSDFDPTTMERYHEPAA